MVETAEKSGFKIETSALRAYTMLGALIVIWIFFQYATAPDCPSFKQAFGLETFSLSAIAEGWSNHVRFFLGFAWISDGIFLMPLNLSNLMTQTSVTGILAVGMLLVIISGNIDLSVGSVLALAGGVAAIVIGKPSLGLPGAIASAIAVCVAIGLLHGVLTAYGKIPAFIVTLGGLLAWRGAVKGVTQSETIPISDPLFKGIGQSYVAPNIGWIIAAAAIAGLLLLALRQIRQVKKYGLAAAVQERHVPFAAVGLFLGAAGVAAFFLNWIGDGGASMSGYRMASEVAAVGGISAGGNAVLWLVPAAFGLIVLAALGGFAGARSVANAVMAAGGLVVTVQCVSVLLAYSNPEISFRTGLFAALFAAVFAATAGLYGLFSESYLKLEPGITVSGLLRLLIPMGAVLGFILVMNAYAGIPIPVLILLAVAILGVFVTDSTTFGRYLYAIGGNADAARLSGINDKVNILKVYAVLGALTGVAAVIFTARLGSATPDAGVLKELDAIAACVIGGASLMGGRGTVFGACLGALIMASLDNGMSLLNVRDFMQELIKGTILVAAVGLDMVGRKQ